MTTACMNDDRWNEAVAEYCGGWHTWNNDSVLSYIRPLRIDGIRLCVKDYKNTAFLENVLIGEEGLQVLPRAHAYDDSYTELEVTWLDNTFRVQTASVQEDLVIRVTTQDEKIKPSTLLVQGLILYNGPAIVRKQEHVLWLDDTPVYCTEEENGELYVPLNSPYLAVPLRNAVGISTGRYRSLEEIDSILEVQQAAYEKVQDAYGERRELYRAMQICQAWDTIYDPVRQTPITTVSRIWNKNWGGYVLFCWDTYFGALMQSLDNKVLAYSNVFAITESITEDGFIPNFACQDGFKSFDRSQPCVGSMVCLEIYHRYGDRWFLERIYDKLRRWNAWFLEARQTKNGLLTWGSNPIRKYYDSRFEQDGEGINDWLGASYESGLDNSPMYENVAFDKERHILELDDVGLTGLYIEDCRCLAEIAGILGKTQDREKLLAQKAEMEARLEDLWDEESGYYLNRRTDTGEWMKRMTPFHFHALFSDRVSEAKVERMLKEHFFNPEEFWTRYPLPATAKNDSSYGNHTYWQGRTWAPMNYLVFCALKRAGRQEAAKALAERSAELILVEWKQHGHVHENYDPETGEGCNSERSDPFYHWGGLLAYMSLLQEDLMMEQQ